MKLTVLTENTTRIDAYYLGEPAVCYYLQDGDKRILFDTGYSDAAARNAEKMGIDLTAVDMIVLSHGHDDHTGGLLFLPESQRKVPLYAHPAVFSPRRCDGLSIGAPITQSQAAEHFELRLSKEPVMITEQLMFLGEIPRGNDFEAQESIGERLENDRWQPDFLPDDSALVYQGKNGLTIITGCSHAGICNIISYAQQLCGEKRIAAVIGGFHLMEENRQTSETVRYFKSLRPKRLCPCHCTCFAAQAAIHAAIPIEEVCVGDTLEFA